MSRPDDVRGVTDDLDRLLADPTSDEAGLAAALRVVRSMGEGPTPEPNHALRELLAHGLPAVVPARSRLAAQALEVERRRRAVRRGVLGLGLGAKIALVAGAAAAVSGAAMIAPVPESVREPAREVICRVGDVVAPWGRGARGGHGPGDRGRPGDVEERPGDVEEWPGGGPRHGNPEPTGLQGGNGAPGEQGGNGAPGEQGGNAPGAGADGDPDPSGPGSGAPGGQSGRLDESPGRASDDEIAGRGGDRSPSGPTVAPSPTAGPDPAGERSDR